MKKTPIRRQSIKHAKRQREFDKLKPALLERCEGCCEKCGRWYGKFKDTGRERCEKPD